MDNLNKGPETPRNDLDKLVMIQKEQIAKSWCQEQEYLLQVWAEKASGWAWLHDNSARFFRHQSNLYVYPSIIINTMAGGIGFISTNKNLIDYLPYVIAVMNLGSAMLSSFQKFLRSTEKAEAHYLYSKIFSSFTRKITLELSLHPKDRKSCKEFCMICKDEYDKAVTDCPAVPTHIIDKFKVIFKDERNKPEIANGLFHFNTYKCTTVDKSTECTIENDLNV